jgi:hypothetical protein
VKYEYVVFVKKDTNIQDILAAVEKGTHMAYTSELLVCNFTRRKLKQNYGYTTAYSAPLDEANPNKACVNPPDPMTQDCYMVNGAATFEYLLGNPDSTLLETQVGAILTDTYDAGALDYVHEDLVRLKFVSFIEETTTETDTTGDNGPAGGDPVGVGVGDGADRSASPSTIGSSVAIAIAAAGLVLVGFFVFRRRGLQIMHTETLDDKDTHFEDGELSTDSLSYESPKATTLNDELEHETSYMQLKLPFDLAKFDLKMTHNPQWGVQPVFVDANLDLTRSHRGQGHARFSHTISQRAYMVPNTVEL